MKKVRAKEL